MTLRFFAARGAAKGFRASARESAAMISGLRARVLALMAAVALGGSFGPLALALAGAGDYPFLFSALWRVGGAVGCGAIILAVWPRLIFNRAALRVLRGRFFCGGMILIVLGQFDFALIALSLRFVDISIAAVMGEMILIFAIFVLAIALRGRHRRLTWRLMGLVLASFAGAVFVGASQRGFLAGGETLPLLLGCAIALSGAAAAGLGAYGLRWAVDAASALARADGRPDASATAVELFYLAVAFGIATAIMIPISGGIGLMAGERILDGAAVFIIRGGALLHAVVGLSWHCANLLSDNLGINALIYFAPILALAWLFLAGRVGVERVDYLLIGVALIVGGNLAIALWARR